MNYPTKEEILNRVTRRPINPMEQRLITEWKDTYYRSLWKASTEDDKKSALEVLILLLWHSTLPALDWRNNLKLEWKDQPSWSYTPATNTITGVNPSIISALHELGHAIHGESELDACVYSTSLFKTYFPKEYGRLTWKGHMLLKQD